MKHFKVTIIFKSGVEKIIETECSECEIQKVLTTINQCYLNDQLSGCIYLNNGYIRVDDTSLFIVEEINSNE